MSLDTVSHAQDNPDIEQPYEQLGLKADEYERIREILGRRPTSSELAMYSVMWSEHCSYKSSKVHLRRFGDVPSETAVGKMLAGIGENAGVVDIGQGWAVTFKVESHNHPSFIEPHQGAATGVGGIVRDIMAMGARPVAVMDQLRFGAIDHPDTARVIHGVVEGISQYGNSLGLPNIGGETVFEECYQGNPLVNALCVGAMRHEDLHLANARGVGNLVVLFGARTGGDGIGGVSVLASETFGEDGSPAARPAVQVGDPFAEKVLIECCLELFTAGVVDGIQDLGGAGLSCATSELASAGDGGMHIELDRVPLRDSTLAPEEILMSESQERMMAVVRPEHRDAFLEITEKWDVEAAILGEVTDSGRLTVTWHGETVVDVPPRTVAHDGPVYERPYSRPDFMEDQQRDRSQKLPRPADDATLREAVLRVAGSPNLCSRSWITNQYDRYVMGNTASSMPDDSGVIRIDEETGLGISVATDCNGRFAQLDPYAGAQLALSEAYRNVAMSGATPIAVTDCLNFGSPEDEGVMWQFAESVRGLADACAELGTPVTGGNVSLYNQTGDTPIYPTPVVGVLGVMDDVTNVVRSGWSEAGNHVWVLGATYEELDGSAWAGVIHDHLGGTPPQVDLGAERSLAMLMTSAIRSGLVHSAHDISEGGLSQALIEACLRFNMGAVVSLGDLCSRDVVSPFVALFSESVARAVVSVSADKSEEFKQLAADSGVPALHIGETGGDSLVVALGTLRAGFVLPLDEVRGVWEPVLANHFGETVPS